MGKKPHLSRKEKLRARKVRLFVLASFLTVLWLVLKADVMVKAIEVVAAALFEVLLAD